MRSLVKLRGDGRGSGIEYISWNRKSNGDASNHKVNSANSTGEKIFPSPRTMCRSVYPDRCQQTNAHQETPVNLREEAYSPLACTMLKRVRTAG
jgi:hypothetical protein